MRDTERGLGVGDALLLATTFRVPASSTLLSKAHDGRKGFQSCSTRVVERCGTGQRCMEQGPQAVVGTTGSGMGLVPTTRD